MSPRPIRFSFYLCMFLFACIALTGLTGYLQVKLDLHRFVLHKYAAYTTLAATLLHTATRWRTILGYIKNFRNRKVEG